MRNGHPKRELSFRFAKHEAVCRVCTAAPHATVSHGEVGRREGFLQSPAKDLGEVAGTRLQDLDTSKAFSHYQK